MNGINLKKATALMIILVLFASLPTAIGASEEDIEAAIELGITKCLLPAQNPDGSWGGCEAPAYTGFALVKLEDRSREKGFEPLDPNGPYYDEISAGLDYLMNNKKTVNPTGEIYFENCWEWHQTYNTGIALMAIANSGSYGDVVQDIVDWFILTQNDDGGWIYDDWNSASDNSNTGYAALGLAYAEKYGANVDPVKAGLNDYVDYIQCDTNGGSGYVLPCEWVNILKTGNLIFEAGFVGDTADSQRVTNAAGYISNHWNDDNPDPGWRPHHYQAMYCVMKGLESMQINEIDGIDWFDEFSTVIVDSQDPETGCWPADNWGDSLLSTEWALLTLEKATVIQVISVDVDIKPGSCPNPLNIKSKGVLPVAVLGTEELDVMTIDPVSIQLTRETEEGMIEPGVYPIRWSYEDVATPFDPVEDGPCCHDLNGDGIMDLTLKFDTQELVTTLKLDEVTGETILLILTGNLKEEYGETPIKGEDCIWIK
jgi:hypothetical protein